MNKHCEVSTTSFYKKPKKEFTEELQNEALEQLNMGFSVKTVSRRVGITKDKIVALKNRNSMIRVVLKNGNTRYKKPQSSDKMFRLEQTLYVWICAQKAQNRPLSEALVKQAAKDINEALGIERTFNASDRWYRRFKSRYRMKFRNDTEFEPDAICMDDDGPEAARMTLDDSPDNEVSSTQEVDPPKKPKPKGPPLWLYDEDIPIVFDSSDEDDSHMDVLYACGRPRKKRSATPPCQYHVPLDNEAQAAASDDLEIKKQLFDRQYEGRHILLTTVQVSGPHVREAFELVVKWAELHLRPREQLVLKEFEEKAKQRILDERRRATVQQNSD